MNTTDRRQHARQPIHRPVKLRDADTVGRYLTGYADNVSVGGASLRLSRPARLLPGQHVRLGIAAHPRQPILRADDMVDATVVRSLAHGDCVHVAVRFLQPARLAIAI